MVLGWIPDIRSGQMTINSSNAPVVIDRGTYTAFSRVRCLMPPDYYAYKEYDFTPFPQYSDTSGIWAVTKDGRYVIVDGRIMRISDGKFLDFTAQHPTASFFTGFTPDSKCAITNDRHILDIATGNYQALLGVSDQWNRPVISPDGAYYTARSGWNQTQALGIGTDTVAATLPFANDILFSNDMAHVFLNNIEVPGANDPDAGMFAFPSGNEIWRVTHKWGTVGDLSPDGSTVVLVPSPSIGPVELRDALTGTIKNRVQWFNLPPIAAFQRSGKFVAAVCDHDDVLPDAPNPVYVFDTTYGKELYTFNVTHHPSCLAFVGDGTLLVGSGVYPDSLAAYNWKTGALLWQKDYEEIASIQVRRTNRHSSRLRWATI
jgi:outer membrane protein assembly factor BamB